jgi:hypothetical protein
MISFDEFVKKYEGKEVGYPNDNYFKGECLSLSKWHIKEVYGIEPPPSGCNGARCYWSIFPNPLGTVLKKIPNTPDLVPKRGWIAVWNGNTGGGYGHIGSVLSADVNNFISLDQNWNGRHAHRVTHNYNNVYGFLAPKSEGDNMADMYKGYDLENKESMKVAVDVLVRLQAGEFVETSKLDELVKVKTAELSSKISDYDRKIKELNTDIFNLNESIRELNQDLEDCQNQVPEGEDLEKDYEATGRRIIKVVGDTTIETSYKRK